MDIYKMKQKMEEKTKNDVGKDKNIFQLLLVSSK